MIYFDHNATGPLMEEARAAWLDAVDRWVGNPSSPHRTGARADAALDDARDRLGRLVGCDPSDIVWTSGATEANNQVLHHFAQTLPDEAEVWISALEHPSVSESARHYFGGRVRTIPAGRDGAVDLNWISDGLARGSPGLVAVMAANNVTGVLQPWREAAELCRERGAPFFCDAVQWGGREPAKGLGLCDFLSGCAHKAGGPRGVGFLKCPPRGRVEPLLFGGSQEENRRAGTENVAGVLAMVAALEAGEVKMGGPVAEVESRRATRDVFAARLAAGLPGVEIAGRARPRLWNTVAAMMPETGSRHRWVVKLDKLGFAVSTGSACSSGREEPSPVLLGMGYAPGEAARILRFSAGWNTTAADWDALLAGVLEAAHELGR